MTTIYAKTLNPDLFDYRVYEYEIEENEDIIIDGGRDFSSINGELLKTLKTFIQNYGGYEYKTFYHNSFKEYVDYEFPNKDNRKGVSPRELGRLKKALDNNSYRWYSEYETQAILVCLSILKGKKYTASGLRGSCQGDYVKCYHPKDTAQKEIDWLEAWYFGTGTEIEVHEEEDEVSSPDEIEGWTFYTASWNIEDIKQEIVERCGYSPNDDVEVKLYKFTEEKVIRIPQYELAD